MVTAEQRWGCPSFGPASFKALYSYIIDRANLTRHLGMGDPIFKSVRIIARLIVVQPQNEGLFSPLFRLLDKMHTEHASICTPL